MQKKVSVIVPVYNADKYIVRCVKSIQKQSYSELEILLIDDASTDKSWECIKYLQEKDERIKIFRQEFNEGPGAARNLGLIHATGEWIFFVDSDDCMKPDMINKMVSCGEKYETEIVICEFSANDCCRMENVEEQRILAKEYFERYFTIFPPTTYIGSNCNKCYKNSIIKDYHLRFDEKERFAEDFRFHVAYMDHVSAVYVIPESLYIYNRHNNSLSTKKVLFAEALSRYERLFVFGYKKFALKMNAEQRKAYRDGYLMAFTNALYDSISENADVKKVNEAVKSCLINKKRKMLLHNASFIFKYPYCIVWVLIRLHLYNIPAYLFYIAKSAKKNIRILVHK